MVDAFCGCCDPAISPTPLTVFNRPGLSEIAFRIGTFSTFREAMLESIAQEAALTGLTSRDSSDYAITLLELFAAAGDVLTFYSERIANELYLRTARERDSLLRLTRLLGYRLRPGLSARTLLSFTLEQNAQVQVRTGLKVMSIPGQNEKPQVFETIEQIAAHADNNEGPAYAPPFLFNGFVLGNTDGPIVARPAKLTAGDKLIFFGLDQIEEKSVTGLTARPDGEVLSFDPGVLATNLSGDVARAMKQEGRLRFFGHNAPDTANVFIPPTPATPFPRWEQVPVPVSLDAGLTEYPLDARYTDISTGTRLLVDAGSATVPRLRTATVIRTQDLPAKLGTIDQFSDTVTYIHVRQTIRGQPTIAAWPLGVHGSFARSGSGAVLGLDPPGSGTRHWSYLDLKDASSDVRAVASSATQQDIFVRNSSANLLQRRSSSGTWAGWVNHGGLLSSEPRPVLTGSGQLLCFVRGSDLGLWVIDATSGTPGAWVGLGGILTSAPAPVSQDASHAAVFVRGLDRSVWYRVWDGTSWADWRSLKGTLGTGPSAASTGAGRIDVVALDDAGALIHRKFDGTEWNDWHNLGGELVGDVALIAGTPDRLDVFARGKDDALWTISRTGEAWGDWTSLGGKLRSAPVAARDILGLHVYVRGGDDSIATRTLTGGAWLGWTSHGDGIGAIADRRQTAVYRIAADDIVFRDYDYPPKIAQGRLALRMTPGSKTVGNLVKGRRILLRSADRIDDAEVVATTPFAAVPGQLEDHLFVDFAPAPVSPLVNTQLLANVAAASHGETQPLEALGHGNGGQSFQTFKLSRPNLTYLQTPSALDGTAALDVRVNGQQWKATPSFFGRSPREYLYTARQNDGGETYVTFGDGSTGARLPSGAMNVTATYRTGSGLQGIMAPNQLSIPLERPVGLRSVTNPLAADGAADPETRDGARGNAPNSVKTFGRAVSLADFEAIVTATGVAARAYVTWVWSELERAVHVTVAGPGGTRLSADTLALLRGGLDAARDPNRPLFLANFVRVPIVVSARLLRDPAYEADAVLENARTKLAAFFDFNAMPLGQAVFSSEIYATLQSATGVLAVDVDVFQLKGYQELTPIERAVRAVDAGPLQPHIRIFPARPTPPPGQIDRFARAGFNGPPPPVLAAEQAYIEEAAADVALTVVEAL